MYEASENSCLLLESIDSESDVCAPAPWGEWPFLSEMTLRLNGRQVKALLSTAAGYIYSRICDVSSNLLKASIPYRYVRGKRHGRIEGKFRRWDMSIDAGGLEGVVDELQRRIWNYEQERFDILKRRWNSVSRSCVFVLEDPDSYQGRVHVVFSGRNALGLVRLHTVLRNCRSIEQSSRLLEEAIDEEKALLTRFIDRQRREVLRTYGSNVTRIPERYRIMRAAFARGPA
jgi:hypothetical protein